MHMQTMHAEELQKSNLELQHRLQEILRQKEEASQTKDSQVDHQVWTCLRGMFCAKIGTVWKLFSTNYGTFGNRFLAHFDMERRNSTPVGT